MSHAAFLNRPLNSQIAKPSSNSTVRIRNGRYDQITAVKREGVRKNIFPMATTIKFDFPARGPGMPAMDIAWYDGKENLPPRPKELEEDRNIETCGKIIYSKDLVFKGGTHSDTLRIIPEEKMKEMANKVPKVTDKNSDHFQNFFLACKGEEKTRSPFHVSGPLTQVFLLGVIAQRLGGTLEFDRTTKQITNNKIANALHRDLKKPKLDASNLPFGGVGNSGFGRYHGKAGFDTFSNPKSVFRQTMLFDIPNPA